MASKWDIGNEDNLIGKPTFCEIICLTKYLRDLIQSNPIEFVRFPSTDICLMAASAVLDYELRNIAREHARVDTAKAVRGNKLSVRSRPIASRIDWFGLSGQYRKLHICARNSVPSFLIYKLTGDGNVVQGADLLPVSHAVPHSRSARAFGYYFES